MLKSVFLQPIICDGDWTQGYCALLLHLRNAAVIPNLHFNSHVLREEKLYVI